MAYYEQSYKKYSQAFRPDSSSRSYYEQRSMAFRPDSSSRSYYEQRSMAFRPDSSSRSHYEQRQKANSQQTYRLSSRPHVPGQFHRPQAFTWVNPNWKPQCGYSSRAVAGYQSPSASVSGSSVRSYSSYSSRSESDYQSPSGSVSRCSQASVRRMSSSYHSQSSTHRIRPEKADHHDRNVTQSRSESQPRMKKSAPAPTFNDIPEFPDLLGTYMNAEMLDQMDAWRKEAASHFVPPATKSPARRDSDSGAGHGRKRKADEMGDLDLTVAPPTKVHVNRHHPRHSRW